MTKKNVYLPPQADVLFLSYAEPVCQAQSLNGMAPNYDLITPDEDFFDVIS